MNTAPRRHVTSDETRGVDLAPAPLPEASLVRREQHLDLACHALEYRSPEYSAHTVLARWQRVGLVVVFLACLLGFVFTPVMMGIALMTAATLAYVCALAFRLAIFQRGARSGHLITISDEEALAVPEDQLPSYTVLVPVFREPLIGHLVDALEELDYPRDRLDIRLLLEAGDTETIEAASHLAPRPHLSVIVVPSADPQTKPKACNYGLLTATGELCTIFDAEDRPDPLQLRRAAVALRQLGQGYACVQAQLGFYNSRQNLLTRWFTLDYGAWFSNMLPGLVAVGAPVPLGGTSNHFRSAVLKAVGGWDPWNVTEDADLGLRLYRAGYHIGVLNSVTLEEANPDPINWIRQRSRWYKGYLQTCLVHLRSPRAVIRQLGWRATLNMVLFVGGTPLLSAINGLFWILTLVWFASHSPVVALLFPPGVYHLGLVCLVGGNLAVIYMNIFTARTMQRADLLLAGLLSPGYWVLMWVAAVKAVVQLISAPSYWEKTAHGLHLRNDASAPQNPDATVLTEAGR